MTKYLQFSQICFNKGKVKVKCLGDKAAGSMCGRGEIYLVSGRWSIDNCLNVNYYQKKRPVQLLDVRGEHSVEDGKWPCLYKLHRLKHLLNVLNAPALEHTFQKRHLNNGESSKENCKYNPGQENKSFIMKSKNFHFFSLLQGRLRHNAIRWKQLLVNNLKLSQWLCLELLSPSLWEDGRNL